MTNLIGIDFSMNAPGLFLYNKNGMAFGALPRIGETPKGFNDVLIEHGVYIASREKYKAVGNSSIDARGFGIDAVGHAKDIINLLRSMGVKDDDNNIVAIEGFSYGSSGSRLAQISGYQFILRHKIMNSISCYDNLYVYAPQTVKSVAGVTKRGAGKVGVIDMFLTHDDILIGLDNNKLYKGMLSTPEIFKTRPTKQNPTGNWRKPIDDMIDAYWIVRTCMERDGVSVY